MPIINRFDGGLVTGVDPIYLATNQATILLDANIENIGLLSAKEPEYVAEGKRSFYQFPILDSEPEAFHITSSINKRSYAEFQGRLAYSDGGPVCQVTDGSYDEASGDFIWNALGTDRVDGEIVARPITMSDDIQGAVATLVVSPTYLPYAMITTIIRYRLVDLDGTVYIHDIPGNSGFATVEWVLPSTDFSVYRELIDAWGNSYGEFVLVSAGQTSFTDGVTEIPDPTTFTYGEAVRDYSGHRMSVYNDRSWTSPYTVVRTDELVTMSVTNLRGADEDNNWETAQFNQSLLLETADADIVAIASTFVYADELYVMMRLGDEVRVFVRDGTPIFISSSGLSEEFFKGTTVEHGGLLYMFSPTDGKIAIFNGSTITYKSMEAMPYAKAEDTVYSLVGDTVYLLANGQHEANVRSLTLPDLTLGYTGEERVFSPLVRGLGGTSNSVLTEGDFVLFPVHGGAIKFSPDTNQIIVPISQVPETDACNIKGYANHTGFGHSIQSKGCGVDTDEALLSSWISNVTVRATLEFFNERTLTGTYIYTVSQRTPDDLSDGPIMDTNSEPVSVFKGHIRVDTTGITHTQPLRLYRTGGYLTIFTMVDDIDLPEIYLDKRDDVTIALGRNGAYDFADAPPEGLNYMRPHRGRLFGAVGSNLYWSEAGDANRWDELLSFVVMDREITGLASCVNGLLVFMRGRIALLLGDSRTSFSLRTVSVEKGSTDSYSIQEAQNGAFFFSNDGLCFTDGANVMELSYNILGPQDFDCIDSTATNRSYYALIKGYTNGTVSKYLKILRYDFGKEPVFSKLNGDNVDGLGTVFGNLAHSMAGEVYDTLKGTARTLNYRSGNITEGIPTMVKEWDRVRVAGEFIGTLIVYMEDKIAIEKSIILVRDEHINYIFPKDANKGKTIAFELVGKGFISSIEYSLTARKTTK